MKYIPYLKTLDFWKQLLIMLIISIVLLVLTMFSLKMFTRHGERIKVPELKGYSLSELKILEEEFGFKFVIRDSVYNENLEPSSIISQSPEPASLVKRNRTFYLTLVARNPIKIAMPNLLELSYRQAKALLESQGLKVGKIRYVSSIAKNAVIEQFFGNEEILPGTMLYKGSEISLNLGLGYGENLEPVFIGDSLVIEEEYLEDYTEEY